MENKTDRRVDKVAAVLQQVVILHGTTVSIHSKRKKNVWFFDKYVLSFAHCR